MTVNKITSPPSQKAVIDKINEVIDNLGGGGVAPVWGNIQGTLSNQTDLQNALDEKQATLVSGTNIKTINSTSLLGSGNINALTNSESGTDTLGILSNPNSNNWSNSVAVGVNSRLNGGSSVTVGYNAIANDYYATVIGWNAQAKYSAIQLGYGTNNTNSTFSVGFYRGTDSQSHNWQLLDGTTGLIPYQRINSLTETRNNNQLKFWTGTKAQYDAIVTKDANTLYNITDDANTTLTLLELLYPVGSIYIGTMSTCPLATLGIGTWQLVATDRVLQGAGTRGSAGTTVNESLPSFTYNGIDISTGWTDNGSIMTQNTSFTAKTYTDTVYQTDAPVQQDAYIVNIWERIS